MLDRLISVLAAVGLACLVWLYARNRDLETVRQRPGPGPREAGRAGRAPVLT